jgi:hypothetical protein
MLSLKQAIQLLRVVLLGYLYNQTSLLYCPTDNPATAKPSVTIISDQPPSSLTRLNTLSSFSALAATYCLYLRVLQVHFTTKPENVDQVSKPLQATGLINRDWHWRPGLS